MRFRILLILGAFLFPSLQVFSKTIYINPYEDITDQFKWENATYIIKGNLDLKGIELEIPKESTLRIKKNALISNGQLKGNQTRLKPPRAPFLKNVILSGTFTNSKAFLTWWEMGEDITQEVNSLFVAFDGKIYLNRPGRLSSTVSLMRKSNVSVDGCHNVFVLANLPGAGFFAKDNDKLEFKNICIRFDGPYLLKNTSYVERCFRLQHAKRSTISIHDIFISDFKNDSDKPCSFCGIDIVECNEGTQTYVYNIEVSNIAVVGDGLEAKGPGSNYGIKVSCQSDKSGKVDIRDCKLEDMCNYNSNGEKIYEDASGIYLAGIRKDADGKLLYCDWKVIISNCSFKNISKRNVKVQGDYVRIEKLESDCTKDFLQSNKNMYVGAEGNHLYIKGIRGRYDGTIVKISGDFLNATDIHCSSELRNSEYARVFTLDGCTHEIIENCSFSNDSYIFIYPTEKGFADNLDPIYTIRNCDINVKHLIYCVSSQDKIYNKGKLIVDNCNIVLNGSICFNRQAMESFDFINTRVITNQTSLVGSRLDGTTPKIVNSKSVFEVYE